MTAPYRFSSRAFLQYAPVIGAALRAWPKPIAVDLRGRLPQSVAQPLRDAITAKQRYGYTHPEVDESQWNLHHKDFRVSQRDNGLYLGPWDATEVTPTEAESLIVSVNARFINEIAFLLHHRAFNPPLSFHLTGLDPVVISQVLARYDVSITPDKDGHVIL